MDNKHVENLIIDYLDGRLSEFEEKAFEKHIDDCLFCQKELQDYKKLLNAFQSEEKAKPSSRVQLNFHKMLEEQTSQKAKVFSINSKKSKKFFYNLTRVAASVTLLVGVFYAGRYSKNKTNIDNVANTSENIFKYEELAITALIENSSASKRIKGLQLFKEYKNPDENVIKAIGNKMLYDDNPNVRLSALEALSQFYSEEQVKSFLLEGLKIEKNPNNQIAIIEILVKEKEQRAVKPLKNILANDETETFIKNEIIKLTPNLI